MLGKKAWRRHGWVVLAIVLGGCGGGSALEVGGEQEAGAANAEIVPSCAPVSGASFDLYVDGVGQCQHPLSGPYTGLWFNFGDPGVAVQAGEVFQVIADAGAPAQGGGVVVMGTMGIAVPGTGTLSFARFVEGQGAAGAYDLALEDGTTAKGTFDAVWCPAPTVCR